MDQLYFFLLDYLRIIGSSWSYVELNPLKNTKTKKNLILNRMCTYKINFESNINKCIC